MDTISEFENSQSNNDREGEIKYLVVHNLVPEILVSYNGTPLSPETSQVLNEFERTNKGASEKREKGESPNLLIISLSKELEEKFSCNSKECISTVQKINPEVPLGNISIYILYSPISRHACALEGKGIAINTNYFLKHQINDEYIKNVLIHEATHVFLNRLGKQPEFIENDFKRDISDFLWYEGLAQYMEPSSGEIGEMFKEDAEKWPKILNTWFNTDTKEEKEGLIKNITNMESFKKILEYRHGKETENRIGVLLGHDSQDEVLRALIIQEGFGYYIGEYLWKREIGKGKELKELVMKGSREIYNWIIKSSERVGFEPTIRE